MIVKLLAGTIFRTSIDGGGGLAAPFAPLASGLRTLQEPNLTHLKALSAAMCDVYARIADV